MADDEDETMLSLVKRGSAYLNLWPDEPRLMAVFPEMRVRAMLRTSRNIIPPAVAFLLFWIYYTCGGFEGLYLLFAHPQAGSMYLYLSVTGLVVVIVVLLLLPVHALMWFGQRAQLPLNRRQQQFYEELMHELGHTPVPSPVMQDFISAISAALKKPGSHDFLDRL